LNKNEHFSKVSLHRKPKIGSTGTQASESVMFKAKIVQGLTFYMDRNGIIYKYQNIKLY